jgi:hypothetical protein
MATCNHIIKVENPSIIVLKEMARVCGDTNAKVIVF